MKKIIPVIIVLCIFISMSLCGCTDNEKLINSDKMSIVATIFPIYDWTREIIGTASDNTELTLLMNNGTDMHSFQPTAADIMKISTCDVLIYVGGESDKWIDEALKNSVNKNTVVINLLDVLSDRVKNEETVDGMQTENGTEHDEEEKDEHIWLSLKNAEIACNEIAKRLADVDSDNAQSYSENASNYIKLLSELDAEYSKAVDKARNKTLLFTDRFPFRYLTDDYGIEYYAAFPGCSAETEASFETITFLADKINELKLNYVVVLEKNDRRVADTVISNTASKTQKILTLNSLQSITEEEEQQGKTYLSVMRDNLKVIEQALG